MSGQRLCNLLNDILDAASLNNRSLRLVDEDVPLAAVCEHVMHLTKAVLKKVRGPSLARPPPLWPLLPRTPPPPPSSAGPVRPPCGIVFARRLNRAVIRVLYSGRLNL